MVFREESLAFIPYLFMYLKVYLNNAEGMRVLVDLWALAYQQVQVVTPCSPHEVCHKPSPTARTIATTVVVKGEVAIPHNIILMNGHLLAEKDSYN